MFNKNENQPKVKINTTKDGYFNEALEKLKNDQDIQATVKGLQVVYVSVVGNHSFKEVKIMLCKGNPIDIFLETLLEKTVDDVAELAEQKTHQEDEGKHD